MLHIANIIEDGKLAGPQVRMAEVASVLLSEAVKTTIIMPRERSLAFQDRCRAYGLIYQTFPLTHITKEFIPALRYISFFVPEIMMLYKYLKKKNFDIIHVSGGSWQYKGVIAGKLAGIKIIWHLNDTCMPWLFRKLFSFFSQFADGYIFASKRSKEYYGSLCKKGKPNFIIPAPVDTSYFDPVKKYRGDEELIKRLKGKIVIGTVGHISPVKGLDLFIQSAAKLNRKFKNKLFFIIIGLITKRQQIYFKKLKRLCSELSINNIEFVGHRLDVRPLLKRIDIYECSSNFESSPVSVWEAMAMEKPIVSTDVGDVPLYIRNGINGFIAKTGDIDAMVEKISILIENKKMRIRFGQTSRRIAVNKLDVKICARRHLVAYKEILRLV